MFLPVSKAKNQNQPPVSYSAKTGIVKRIVNNKFQTYTSNKYEILGTFGTGLTGTNPGTEILLRVFGLLVPKDHIVL